MEDSDDNTLPTSDTPINLRPDLTEYGIEEVDRGICLDTAENRNALRSNKLSWIAIYDHSGRPTNTIEVRSRDMIEARSLNALEGRASILYDSRDKNSDYQSGLELLYNIEADRLVPSWVMAGTRAWVKLEEQREENPDKKIKPQLITPPGRCSVIKSDGVRCMLWHSGRISDQGMCKVHLGASTRDSVGAVEKARNRISQGASIAVEILEEMMYATSEPVRLKAATEILDRAGVRGGVEVDINATVSERPAVDVLNERLARIRKIEEQRQQAELEAGTESDTSPVILDAEVVEDDD